MRLLVTFPEAPNSVLSTHVRELTATVTPFPDNLPDTFWPLQTPTYSGHILMQMQNLKKNLKRSKGALSFISDRTAGTSPKHMHVAGSTTALDIGRYVQGHSEGSFSVSVDCCH